MDGGRAVQVDCLSHKDRGLGGGSTGETAKVDEGIVGVGVAPGESDLEGRKSVPSGFAQETSVFLGVSALDHAEKEADALGRRPSGEEWLSGPDSIINETVGISAERVQVDDCEMMFKR
jgi:hypothetical protein